MSDFKIKVGDSYVNIDEVEDIEVLRGYLKREKEKHINTLNLGVESENDLESLKLMISILYEIMNYKKSVVIRNYLSDKYKTALCLYILYGYNKESKEKVKKVLGLKNQIQVNSLNNNLRSFGLLYKDKMNNSISHLCHELTVIGNFYKKFKKEGKMGIRIVV